MRDINNDLKVTPKKDNRKLIYGILTVILLATWGYIIYDKNTTKEAIAEKNKQILSVNTEKDSVQLAFNNASARLDSLTSNNTSLQGNLATKNEEVLKLRSEISGTLGRANATKKELAEAKEKINELNSKIDGLFADLEKLKAENLQLTSNNAKLSSERDSLLASKQNLQKSLSDLNADKKNVENLASTLHATNVKVDPFEKSSKGKEKETTNAKSVNFFRITFDLDPNMLSPTGTKEIYLCLSGPDGKPISKSLKDSVFTSRTDGSKAYAVKTNVEYEQGKKASAKVDWKKDGAYEIGKYKLEIYNNGFKIGEGSTDLKKGGWF